MRLQFNEWIISHAKSGIRAGRAGIRSSAGLKYEADYFNTAYGPSEEYPSPYHGIILCQGTTDWRWHGKTRVYRYHIEDPIFFEQSIKVTIEHGHAHKLTNDYASTAYWYQTKPHAPFLPMLPVEQRLPRL